MFIEKGLNKLRHPKWNSTQPNKVGLFVLIK